MRWGFSKVKAKLHHIYTSNIWRTSWKCAMVVVGKCCVRRTHEQSSHTCATEQTTRKCEMSKAKIYGHKILFFPTSIKMPVAPNHFSHLCVIGLWIWFLAQLFFLLIKINARILHRLLWPMPMLGIGLKSRFWHTPKQKKTAYKFRRMRHWIGERIRFWIMQKVALWIQAISSRQTCIFAQRSCKVLIAWLRSTSLRFNSNAKNHGKTETRKN